MGMPLQSSYARRAPALVVIGIAAFACARGTRAPNVTVAAEPLPAQAAATPAGPTTVASRPQRERPAMVPCPWPMRSSGDTLGLDPAAPPAPVGVLDPPRARIPD